MSNPQTTIPGYDLGTTNSTGARLEGTSVRVFRSIEQSECVPSAVWFDKANKKRVGKLAYDRAESDPGNVAVEFKRGMGTKDEFRFASSGLVMRPEQLSAEVLKSLRADTERATNEIITQAVITVPAMFELPGRDATLRAAALAGLTSVDLIQEPVAAALAYSFDRDATNAFWLIYDFGGGTFDTTLIQMRDGVVSCVEHGGNNRLGGKNIDWAIVDSLLLPAASKQLGVSDLARGNPKWLFAIAKLKMAAEAAKKALSADDSYTVEIENFGGDGTNTITFEHTLTRQEIESITRPIVTQSIDICRDIITKAKLKSEHIAKLVLVGGPTQMPLVRDMLADPSTGLGIKLEADIDPMTVVARGAALFGASQRIKPVIGPEQTATTIQSGHFAAVIDAPKLSPDTDTLVSIAFVAAKGDSVDLSTHSAEIINTSSQPAWRSGKIALTADGKLTASVYGEQNKHNCFKVELLDSTGRQQEVTPNDFTITVKGGVMDDPLLTRNIGVALADNTVCIFLTKGMGLPAKRSIRLRTARHLRAGSDGELLRVPLVEGERPRADRNAGIGELKIPGDHIDRDVPYNSPIDITIECDTSGSITVVGYLDLLDKDFEATLALESVTFTQAELKTKLEALDKRRHDLIEEANKLNEAAISTQLLSTDIASRMSDLQNLIRASPTDNDAARQAADGIIQVHVLIDSLEPALDWPRIREAALSQLRDNEQANAGEYAKPEDSRIVATLAPQLHAAIEQKDAHRTELLRRELLSIEMQILDRDWGTWASRLVRIKRNPPKFTDAAAAQVFMDKALASIELLDGGTRFRLINENALIENTRRLRDLIEGGSSGFDSDAKSGVKMH